MTLPIRNSRIRLSQGQLFWREVGEGEALVFLHGSWVESSQWVPLIEHLSRNYHCLAPDLLGFGESEQPQLHYSVELEVELLAEYFESLRLRQVVLVGHSLGGWVAVNYALRFPDQVKGLVLIEPEGVELERKGDRWFWERLLTGQPPLLAWVLNAVAPLAKVLGWQDRIKQLRQLRQRLLGSPVACRLLFKRRRAEIRAELVNERLPWLKLPILILQGEGDRSTVVALNRLYAEAPDAELRLISEASSNVLETSPEAIAQEISKFLAAQLS